MIRVLLADDQPGVRAALRMLLEPMADVEVVGEATDGREAVAAARRLRPDVVLMDIRMPRMDGIEATRALAGEGVPDPIAVVVLTTFDLDEYVHGALRAGASGFLLKDAGPQLIGEALRAAVDGGALIAPAVTVRLLGELVRPDPAARQPIPPLTDREEEVLALLAAGLTNDEISARLHVSLGTTKAHVGAILQKVGLRNRVEAAMWAVESGRVAPGR